MNMQQAIVGSLDKYILSDCSIINFGFY